MPGEPVEPATTTAPEACKVCEGARFICVLCELPADSCECADNMDLGDDEEEPEIELRRCFCNPRRKS